MSINDRVRLIRNSLKMTQSDFGSRLAITQNHLSLVEKGTREVTDRLIKLIVFEFNVNEEWIRNGAGEMFVQVDTFSLDDYAKKNNLSGLEIDIIKSYMDLDSNIRKSFISHLQTVFGKHNEVAATSEVTYDETTLANDDSINEELNNYRKELEAEKKGETLSASVRLGGKSS